MNLDLKNKIALVTGASAGLGREIAFNLAREGAKVAISGRRKAQLNETAVKISKETEAEVLTFVGDMTQKKNVTAFVNQVINELDTIHILVNNVGQATRGYLDSLSQSDWQQHLKLIY